MTCQGPSAADWRLAWQSSSQCARLPTSPGGGDRCGTVCHRKHRRQILRGHAAVSTSARRPGGRIDRGRATGLPVAPIRLRRRERTDGPRTPTDLREDPRTRTDVQDADESLASWTRHRIGVRQRHRRRITGAPARFAYPFLEPPPAHPGGQRARVAFGRCVAQADGLGRVGSRRSHCGPGQRWPHI